MEWLKGLFGAGRKSVGATPPQPPQADTPAVPSAEARQRSESSDPPSKEVVEFFDAYPSHIFPDFPLNPQNLFHKDGLFEGQYLLNIAVIGQSICESFEAWRAQAPPRNWPSYADGELSALRSAFSRMRTNVQPGIRHSVDTAEVKRLAAAYIDRVRSDEEVHTKFMGARLTLFNLSIDFANTIACGGSLQTILDWYE